MAAGEVQGARLRGRPLPDLGADGLHLASPGERRHPATPGREVGLLVDDSFCCLPGFFMLLRGSNGAVETVVSDAHENGATVVVLVVVLLRY